MLPFIGSAIGPVWYAVVLTVGLAEVHRTRIEIALFGPLVINRPVTGPDPDDWPEENRPCIKYPVYPAGIVKLPVTRAL